MKALSSRASASSLQQARPLSSCYHYPVGDFFRTFSSYVWWTHARGSIHYDVMVTLILLFLFLAPYKIDFRDKPAAPLRHPNQVTAYSDARGGVVYEVPAAAVAANVRDGHDAAALQSELGRVLQPVAGPVTFAGYEPVSDDHGRLQSYRVWMARPLASK